MTTASNRCGSYARLNAGAIYYNELPYLDDAELMDWCDWCRREHDIPSIEAVKEEVVIDDKEEEEVEVEDKNDIEHLDDEEESSWGRWETVRRPWRGQDKLSPPKKLAAKARPEGGEGSRPKRARVEEHPQLPKSPPAAPPTALASAPSSGALTGGAENAKAGSVSSVAN